MITTPAQIDSDDNGSIVFADSQSGEKDTSISVPENADECREILKNVVINYDVDINKKPISITVFRGSCASAQLFSSEFWQIFKNTYFMEHLRTAAYGLFRKRSLDSVNNI